MAELPTTLLKRSAAYLVSKQKKHFQHWKTPTPPPRHRKGRTPSQQPTCCLCRAETFGDGSHPKIQKKTHNHLTSRRQPFTKIHGMVMNPTSTGFRTPMSGFFFWSIRQNGPKKKMWILGFYDEFDDLTWSLLIHLVWQVSRFPVVFLVVFSGLKKGISGGVSPRLGAWHQKFMGPLICIRNLA